MMIDLDKFSLAAKKKADGISLCMGFMLLAVAAAAHAMPPDKLYAVTAPGVWRVFAMNAQGAPFSQGSGVVIARETLITNCHVIAGAKSVVVKHDNQSFDVRLQHIDLERDLCQLTARNMTTAPVPLGDSDKLVVGQKVYTLGSPRGLELTLSDGLVSGLRNDEQSMKLMAIQISAPISPGSSGGGLFDENGKLIGITRAVLRDAQNINLAVPINWLRELPARSTAALAKYRAESSHPIASAGIVAPPPESGAPNPSPQGIPLSPPPPSGYAELNDAAKLDRFGVRKGYEKFLTNQLPRAFAFTDDGSWWASWGLKPRTPGAPKQPYLRIIADCEKAYQRRCYLYAVDNDVVYKPDAEK